MIDTQKLKELIQLMVDNDLSELDVRDGEETVTLKRGGAMPPTVMAMPSAMSAPAFSPGLTGGAAGAPSGSSGTVSSSADPSLVAIESPMVGTFYSSPNPDAPPFVASGASVGPDTVVCIVEAMKVFNEIKAEKAGTIVQMLVKSGQSVEFGQKLFLIKPS